MKESIEIPDTGNRQDIYRSLVPQVRALIDGEPDTIANMANIAAVLKEALKFFWVGFYIVRADNLVLGPFQGALACTRIAKNAGVCGYSWAEKKAVIVPDVDRFPGHIACSAASRSEIVIPAIRDGEVRFVLDIDSAELDDFTKVDERNLQRIVNNLLENSEI